MASLPVTIFKLRDEPRMKTGQELAWVLRVSITVAVLGLNILARFITRQK